MDRELTPMEKAVFGHDAQTDIFGNPIEQGSGALPVKIIPRPAEEVPSGPVPLDEYPEDEMPEGRSLLRMWQDYEDLPEDGDVPEEYEEPVKPAHKKKKGK